jgi:twitching motility protein PilT
VPVAVPVPAPVASAAAAVTPVAATPGPVEPGTLAIYLARVAEDGASDLLLSSGQPARARVGGQWHELNGPVPDDAQIWALVEAAMSEAHRDALRRSGSCDLPYAATLHGRRLRFRVNLFRQHGGLAAAFRPIRRHPPTLDELNLPEALRALVGYPHGLVLVTGPTGAGKSTTLIALVEQLNREAARHIVTLEDPIEYEYTPQRSFIHQRELGAHVDSFEAGLRAALREAPDVILVGEMRDRATIAAALTAAQTGHLVLSSLHAASAAMAVERVVDVFPDYQQRQVRSELATSLRAVLTQQLLPTRGGERLPAIELCVVTAAVGALIRDDRTYQITSAIQTGREDGMIPLDRSLAELVASGRVELETAAAVTPDGGVQLRELLRAGASAPPRAPSPPREPPELRSGGRGPYR